MNRREAAKLAAAAAAGSVLVPAGRDPNTLTDPEMLQVMRDALAQIPKPSPETEAHLERCRQRFDEATRLQSAIELGDRTAEELGLGLHSFDLERERECSGTVTWTATFWYRPGDNPCGWDPDPLTAVQKAREAALKWLEKQPDAGPTKLPQVEWRKVTERGIYTSPNPLIDEALGR